MRSREAVFALALLIAAALITTGLALLSTPVALIGAGVLLSAWVWLVLGE